MSTEIAAAELESFHGRYKYTAILPLARVPTATSLIQFHLEGYHETTEPIADALIEIKPVSDGKCVMYATPNASRGLEEETLIGVEVFFHDFEEHLTMLDILDRTNDTKRSGAMYKVTFFLNTTPALFTHWLEQFTRGVEYRDFPTERGRIALQSARGHPHGMPTHVSLSGNYIYPAKDNNSKILVPHDLKYIQFELIPLNSQRTEVAAECNETVPIAAYFVEILEEIAKRWPEADAEIQRFRDGFARQPETMERDTEPPRVETIFDDQLSVSAEVIFNQVFRAIPALESRYPGIRPTGPQNGGGIQPIYPRGQPTATTIYIDRVIAEEKEIEEGRGIVAENPRTIGAARIQPLSEGKTRLGVEHYTTREREGLAQVGRLPDASPWGIEVVVEPLFDSRQFLIDFTYQMLLTVEGSEKADAWQMQATLQARRYAEEYVEAQNRVRDEHSTVLFEGRCKNKERLREAVEAFVKEHLPIPTGRRPALHSGRVQEVKGVPFSYELRATVNGWNDQAIGRIEMWPANDVSYNFRLIRYKNHCEDSDFAARREFFNALAARLKEYAKSQTVAESVILPSSPDAAETLTPVQAKQAADKPRVPTRLKDLKRWKATWRAVKGQWQSAKSYGEICRWLEKARPELGCSPETLADIVRAGEAKLLESSP